MPRVVKEEDYAQRRNEILDVTRQLVYTKGYEAMSIQDILNSLKISKGAFYHYFDSKQDLLEGLIDRMGEEARAHFVPLMEDPSLPALEKLRQYFSGALQWKASQKDYMLELLKVWYSDENAIIRQKVSGKMLKWVAPPFGGVVRQGIREGVFSTDFPDQATEIIIFMITALGDKFGDVILGHEHSLSAEERFDILEKAVAAYTAAIERILGARAGSIELMDANSIRVWIE